MPSAVARLWITSRMSARSKLRTIASSSLSGASPAGSSAAGAAGGGAFCARADAAAIAVASRTASIRRPFTAPPSGRTSALAARPLAVLLELIELLLHLGGERRGPAPPPPRCPGHH